MDLRDAHVFVAGGSTGVGAALARRLAGEGARLTLLALPGGDLDAVAAETGAKAMGLDLSRFQDLEGVISKAEAENGPVDVLMCNAAMSPSGPFEAMTAADVHDSITVNLMSHMELVRQVLPGMLARGAGTITATGSLSTEVSLIHLGCYVPGKAGLAKFALDLGNELRGSGVRVFAFLLGSVKGTPLANKAIEDPVVAFIEQRFGGVGVLTPDKVAGRMVEVLRSRRPGGAVTIPAMGRPAVALRLLPARLADPLIGRPARRYKAAARKRPTTS